LGDLGVFALQGVLEAMQVTQDFVFVDLSGIGTIDVLVKESNPVRIGGIKDVGLDGGGDEGR
jgi:hypothetical protein